MTSKSRKTSSKERVHGRTGGLKTLKTVWAPMSHILQGHLAEELDYGPINDGESSDRGLRLIALYPLPTLDHSLLIVQNKEGRVITIEVDNEYR